MTTITLSNTGEDIPESHCSQCDTRFNIIWQRGSGYEGIEYCPFCGDEVSEVVREWCPLCHAESALDCDCLTTSEESDET